MESMESVERIPVPASSFSSVWRLLEVGRPYRNDAMWQLHEDMVAAAAWEKQLGSKTARP